MSKHVVMWKDTDQIVCEAELPEMPDDGSVLYIDKTESNIQTFREISDATIQSVSLVEKNVFQKDLEDKVKNGVFQEYGAQNISVYSDPFTPKVVHASDVTTKNPKGEK